MENPLGESKNHVVVDNMIPPPYNPNMGFDYNMPPPPNNFGGGNGGMPSYQPLEQPPPVYIQPVVPVGPPYMPPPANNSAPVIGQPISDNNNAFPSFYNPSTLPPINNYVPPPNHNDIEDDSKPKFLQNRGYTLYDPSGVNQFIPEPQNQPQ